MNVLHHALCQLRHQRLCFFSAKALQGCAEAAKISICTEMPAAMCIEYLCHRPQDIVDGICFGAWGSSCRLCPICVQSSPCGLWRDDLHGLEPSDSLTRLPLQIQRDRRGMSKGRTLSTCPFCCLGVGWGFAAAGVSRALLADFSLPHIPPIVQRSAGQLLEHLPFKSQSGKDNTNICDFQLLLRVPSATC